MVLIHSWRQSPRDLTLSDPSSCTVALHSGLTLQCVNTGEHIHIKQSRGWDHSGSSTGGWGSSYSCGSGKKSMGQSSNSDELDLLWGSHVHIPSFSWHLRKRICLCVGCHTWWSPVRTWMERLSWPHSSSSNNNQVCEGIRPTAQHVSIGCKSICRGKSSFLFLFYYLNFSDFIHKYYIFIISTSLSTHSKSSYASSANSPNLSFNITVVKYMCVYTYVYMCTRKYNLMSPFSVGHVYTHMLDNLLGSIFLGKTDVVSLLQDVNYL